MTQALDALAAQMLNAAKAAGADAADAMAVRGTSLSVDVRAGKLEEAQREEGTDIGLRVIVGKRQACVSSSDVRPETIDQMAERAVAMARLAPEDPTTGLAEASDLATDRDVSRLDLCDPTADPDPARLQDDAARAEAAALAVKGVSQVQSASAAFGRRSVWLAASNGFSAGYERSDRSISCVAITGTGTGMERDYDFDSRIFQADLRSAEDIGASAAERAIVRAAPRKPKTGAYPVLFDERIANSLIGHILQAINGAMIGRGSSWLRNAMGEQILPKGLSIIEDPHRPRTSASRLFDSEGLPTSRRAIVEDGILRTWTLDLATARKLGLQSTANAARGTSAPPSPAATNIALTQGSKTRDQLLAEMGTGLLITSMIGSTINPNTGDYSRGASGFWVENGEIAYPVNECTVAGNLRDMLMRITPANDGRAHLSRVVPSLLVEGLTLAGE